MKTLIHFVANSNQISHLTIAKMICNALIEHLGNSEFNIKNFWINEKIVDIILTPLINWSQQQQQNYLAINLCRLTEIIFSSETGIGKFGSEDKTNFGQQQKILVGDVPVKFLLFFPNGELLSNSPFGKNNILLLLFPIGELPRDKPVRM